MSDSKENVKYETHRHDNSSIDGESKCHSAQMVVFNMFEIPAPLASPPPGVSVATSAGIANDAYTTANTGCALGQSSRFFHVRSGRVFVDIIVFLDQSLMIGTVRVADLVVEEARKDETNRG